MKGGGGGGGVPWNPRNHPKSTTVCITKQCRNQSSEHAHSYIHTPGGVDLAIYVLWTGKRVILGHSINL